MTREEWEAKKKVIADFKVYSNSKPVIAVYYNPKETMTSIKKARYIKKMETKKSRHQQKVIDRRNNG